MLYFNGLFLGYVALFGLSLFTLLGGVLGLDPPGCATGGRGLRVGVVSGYLAAIALFFAAGRLSEVVPATLRGEVPESTRSRASRRT